MALSNIFSGARAKVGMYNPQTGLTQIIGSFSNVSYSWMYSTQSAPILGRFTVAEIDYVDAQEVTVTASGWRSIGHGPHVVAGLPKLQELLTADYITLVVLDRQAEVTGGQPRVFRLDNVRTVGYSTGSAVKQLSEITVTFIGITASDESVTNAEDATATQLP